MNAIQFKIPTTEKEMVATIQTSAKVLIETAVMEKSPTAKLLIEFLDADGPYRVLLDKFAEKMGIPKGSNTEAFQISACAGIGISIADLEVEHIKDVFMKKKKADITRDMIRDYMLENWKEASVIIIGGSMEKIRCNCASCLAFWSAHTFFLKHCRKESWKPSDFIKQELLTLDTGPYDEKKCVIGAYKTIWAEHSE